MGDSAELDSSISPVAQAVAEIEDQIKKLKTKVQKILDASEKVPKVASRNALSKVYFAPQLSIT